MSSPDDGDKDVPGDDDGTSATSSLDGVDDDDCASLLSYGSVGGGGEGRDRRDELPSLPPLRYARLAGTLPRSGGEGREGGEGSSGEGSGPISSRVTASALGRVAVRPPAAADVARPHHKCTSFHDQDRSAIAWRDIGLAGSVDEVEERKVQCPAEDVEVTRSPVAIKRDATSIRSVSKNI